MRARRSRPAFRAHAPARPEVRGEINVTPLVDVVLVLLIIFMVVTPMLTRGAKVELPLTDHHDRRQDGDQIVVSVTAEGRVLVDTRPADGERLVDELRASLAVRGRGGRPREVHVKADRRLRYGAVRRVLDRVHEAGAREVALATDERTAGAR
jgi:biopolymer transport protein ExbD